MSKKNKHGFSTEQSGGRLSDGAVDTTPLTVTLAGSFTDRGGKVERLIAAHLAEAGRSGLHKAVFIGTAKSKRQGQEQIAVLGEPYYPPQAICGLAVCPEGQAVLKFAIYATAK